MSTHRAVFIRAIEATFRGDRGALRDVFVDDVVACSPTFAVTCRAQLEDEFEGIDEALSNVVVAIDRIDLVGDRAFAEWRVAADHSGPMLIADDVLVEPTGQRILLAGATFANFRADRICSFRSYF